MLQTGNDERPGELESTGLIGECECGLFVIVGRYIAKWRYINMVIPGDRAVGGGVDKLE